MTENYENKSLFTFRVVFQIKVIDSCLCFRPHGNKKYEESEWYSINNVLITMYFSEIT